MFTPTKLLRFRTRNRWRSRAQYLRAGAYRISRVCARLESRAVAGAFGFPACCAGGAGGVVAGGAGGAVAGGGLAMVCRAAAGGLRRPPLPPGGYLPRAV